jgi:hypothetical protein
MMMVHRLAAVGGLLAVLCVPSDAAEPIAAPVASIEGDYIEARTADVFTGPCFSNSEVFITGHQAVLAWKVRRGAWAGEDLSGLTVAAAVRASTTISHDDPEAAKSVVLVDERATPAQRAALVEFARHVGGDRLNHVASVQPASMLMTVETMEAMNAEGPTHAAASNSHAMPTAPKAMFLAYGLAEVLTRPLDETDHLCGNETVAYGPIASGVDVTPAYTLRHGFRGKGLDATWSDPSCRSSFVGQFRY